MNSDNEEIEGRKLIQAWKSASTPILVDFDSPMRDSSLDCVGLITTVEDNLIVLDIGDSTVVEIDLSGARFSNVGTRERFSLMNLDPSRYREMVEIRLADMGRLALAAPVEL